MEEKSLEMLLRAIIQVRDKLDSVSVDNFDEVKASLRNELSRAMKPIAMAVKAGSETDMQLAEVLGSSLDVMLVRKPITNVKIDNFDGIKFPDSTKVNNLSDLKSYFEELGVSLTSAINKLPAPIVNVNSPTVRVPDFVIPEIKLPIFNIPETRVTIEDKDSAPLLEAIKRLDEQISKASDKTDRQALAFSSGLNESSARKAFKAAINSTTGGTIGGSGALELTDANAGVVISATSVPCNYVEICANDGLAMIGDSAVVQTSGSEVGVKIYPGNIPYKVQANNLNQVFASGANGTRISWTYFV